MLQPSESSFVIHLISSQNPRCRSVLIFLNQLQVTFRWFPENTAVWDYRKYVTTIQLRFRQPTRFGRNVQFDNLKRLRSFTSSSLSLTRPRHILRTSEWPRYLSLILSLIWFLKQNFAFTVVQHHHVSVEPPAQFGSINLQSNSAIVKNFVVVGVAETLWHDAGWRIVYVDIE